MRAKQFTEAALGTSPKRPARAGSRPDRGHEPVARYKTNEANKPKQEAPKPRNFVAKNAMATTSGAGAHRDKKKEQKQGYEKHKNRDLEINEMEEILDEHKKGVRAMKYNKKPKSYIEPVKPIKPQGPVAPGQEQPKKPVTKSVSKDKKVTEWKASRALCRSSTPDADLGASALASCKSQGLRARDGNKSHKLGKSAKSRVKVDGHRIKGRKYGGPLPDWS